MTVFELTDYARRELIASGYGWFAKLSSPSANAGGRLLLTKTLLRRTLMRTDHRPIPREALAMTFTWSWVTPETATDWLQLNRSNRTVRRHRVESYARDNRAGRWRIHHQGIAFDTNGFLIDGQHRLMMIVESDLAALLLVVRNCPSESALHVDEILPRSTKDAMELRAQARLAISNSSIAICKLIELLPDRVHYRYSREEEALLVERFSPSATFAGQSSTRGLTRGIRTAIARAHLATDQSDRLSELLSVLGDGMPVSMRAHEDSAAITLRNYAINNQTQGGATWEMQRYMKAQSCIRSFLERTPMSKVYGTADDLFPLPEQFLPTIAVNTQSSAC